MTTIESAAADGLGGWGQRRQASVPGVAVLRPYASLPCEIEADGWGRPVRRRPRREKRGPSGARERALSG